MKFSIDSKIGDLIRDEQAKAVLEKHLPGSTTHPMLGMALGMTLRQISYYPESGLTAAKLKALDEDLQKL